jgi:hypothetical protein
MRYILYFVTGRSISVSGEQALKIFSTELNAEGRIEKFTMLGDGRMVNRDHITHIEPEGEAGSGVLIRPTPEQLKNEEARKMESIRSDPKALINRIHQKAEGDESAE